MSDWLRLSGNGPALNMALAISVELLEQGKAKIVFSNFSNNTTLFLHDDQARRLAAWLDAHAELPVLAPDAI